jgi:TPR repeat protein
VGARKALRDALKTPGAAADCWRAARRLAVKAHDEELAAFALEAVRADKADDPLNAPLTELADAEAVGRIAKERDAFQADLEQAEAGNAEAMRRVGDAYSEGLGVPSDDEFGVE